MSETGFTEGGISQGFFEWVFDAFEGMASAVDGELHSTSHRRGLKVWYDDAKKEHYEAQLIRVNTSGDVGLEIGFHAEYSKDDENQVVLDKLLGHEQLWRNELGGSAVAGMFLGADRWRRISEVWDAPDPDDPESTFEIAARLADYVMAIEPVRRS
jgi:hypothetical protein